MLTAVPHYSQYLKSKDGGDKTVWSSRPHYEIENLAKKMEAPYLNSYEALRPYIQGTVQTWFYYNGDMHFNPHGYELWANAQINFLLLEGKSLLPTNFYSHINGSIPIPH